MRALQQEGLSVLPWLEVPAAVLSLERAVPLAPLAWVALLGEQAPE